MLFYRGVVSHSLAIQRLFFMINGLMNILIIGASSGIGRELALLYAEEGASGDNHREEGASDGRGCG